MAMAYRNLEDNCVINTKTKFIIMTDTHGVGSDELEALSPLAEETRVFNNKLQSVTIKSSLFNVEVDKGCVCLISIKGKETRMRSLPHPTVFP
jgi:hypothetical protein